MGLIARQSFKAATVTYMGVVLGIVNTLFIYTKMLTVEQYGELTFMYSTVSIVAPFLLLGFSSVLIKYYPIFKDDELKKQALFTLSFGVVLFNILLFLLIAIIFQKTFFSWLTQGEELLVATTFSIIGISCLQPVIYLATAYANVHKRIAIPSVLIQLIKISQPILVIFYFYDFISFEQVVYGMFTYYLFLTMGYLGYAFSLEKFKPVFSLKNVSLPIKGMLSFALFSVLGSLGAVLTNQIDVIMITSMLGKYQTGLYGWSMFIVNAIVLPASLLGAISTPLISEYWKNNNKKELNKLYRQSSSTLLVISLGLFICLLFSLEELFALMPKGDEFRLAKYLVIMLCSAKIIDLATGLNNQIISMSDSYRYLLLFLSIAVVVNIILNVLLIPIYGINGSAIATIVSVLIYNVIKYIFLKKKFDLEPFSLNTLRILGVGFSIISVGLVIPKTSLPLLNIFLFSGTAFFVYFGLMYKLKLAPELNDFANKQLIQIGIKPFDKK